MDSLQISGKLYISLSRAAKEHGYTPDAIEELVRTGKIKGQKVGGAWFAEVQSLTAYFSENKDSKRAPISKIERKSEQAGEALKPKQPVRRVDAVAPAPVSTRPEQANVQKEETQNRKPIKASEEEHAPKNEDLLQSGKKETEIVHSTQKAEPVFRIQPVVREPKVKVTFPRTERPLLTYIKEEATEPELLQMPEAVAEEEPEVHHIPILRVSAPSFKTPTDIPPIPHAPPISSPDVKEKVIAFRESSVAVTQAPRRTKNLFRRAIMFILLGIAIVVVTVCISLFYAHTALYAA